MNKRLEEALYRLEGEYAEMRERHDPRAEDLKKALKIARNAFGRAIDFCWKWGRGRF